MSQVKLRKRADGVKTSYRDRDGNWSEFETYALLGVVEDGRRIGTLSTGLKSVSERLAGLSAVSCCVPVWRVVGVDCLEYDRVDDAVDEVVRLFGILGYADAPEDVEDA